MARSEDVDFDVDPSLPNDLFVGWPLSLLSLMLVLAVSWVAGALVWNLVQGVLDRRAYEISKREIAEFVTPRLTAVLILTGVAVWVLRAVDHPPYLADRLWPLAALTAGVGFVAGAVAWFRVLRNP